MVWDTDLPNTFAAQNFPNDPIWFLSSQKVAYPIRTVVPSANEAGKKPKHYSVDCYGRQYGSNVRKDGNGGQINCELTSGYSSDHDGCNPQKAGAKYYHVCGASSSVKKTNWAVYAPVGESCENVSCEPNLVCCDSSDLGACGSGGRFEHCQRRTHGNSTDCGDPKGGGNSNQDSESQCPPLGLYRCNYSIPCEDTEHNASSSNTAACNNKREDDTCHFTETGRCKPIDSSERHGTNTGFSGKCYLGNASSDQDCTTGTTVTKTTIVQRDIVVRGKCGPSPNTCLKGDFHNHPPNTSTHYKWTCRNIPHSTSEKLCRKASNDVAKPEGVSSLATTPQKEDVTVDVEWGPAENNCTINFRDGSCGEPSGSCLPKGVGGGNLSQEICTVIRYPVCDPGQTCCDSAIQCCTSLGDTYPSNPRCSGNGACDNSVKYGCSVGTAINKGEKTVTEGGATNTYDTWDCLGVNGGSSTTGPACQKIKVPVTPCVQEFGAACCKQANGGTCTTSRFCSENCPQGEGRCDIKDIDGVCYPSCGYLANLQGVGGYGADGEPGTADDPHILTMSSCANLSSRRWWEASWEKIPLIENKEPWEVLDREHSAYTGECCRRGDPLPECGDGSSNCAGDGANNAAGCCAVGVFHGHPADTSTEWKWTCKKSLNDNSDSVECSESIPIPECDIDEGQYETQSTCEAVIDNDSCVRENDCWIRGPAVNGDCGDPSCDGTNACSAGNFTNWQCDQNDGEPAIKTCQWHCEGINGGSDVGPDDGCQKLFTGGCTPPPTTTTTQTTTTTTPPCTGTNLYPSESICNNGKGSDQRCRLRPNPNPNQCWFRERVSLPECSCAAGNSTCGGNSSPNALNPTCCAAGYFHSHPGDTPEQYLWTCAAQPSGGGTQVCQSNVSCEKQIGIPPTTTTTTTSSTTNTVSGVCGSDCGQCEEGRSSGITYDDPGYSPDGGEIASSGCSWTCYGSDPVSSDDDDTCTGLSTQRIPGGGGTPGGNL